MLIEIAAVLEMVNIVAKKKKYTPKTDDDWDEDEMKKHRRTIKDKEKAITAKYKKFWDQERGQWKDV